MTGMRSAELSRRSNIRKPQFHTDTRVGICQQSYRNECPVAHQLTKHPKSNQPEAKVTLRTGARETIAQLALIYAVLKASRSAHYAANLRKTRNKLEINLAQFHLWELGGGDSVRMPLVFGGSYGVATNHLNRFYSMR